MKLETLESMKLRRSVRAYKPEQIADAELDLVLEAGVYAASGRNMQATKLVVVQDEETRALLSKINAEYLGVETDPFYGAPTYVAVFGGKHIRPTYVEDGSLVLGNLMLGAYAVGLGSCWIHRAKETFEDERGKELMRKWGVEEGYVGVGFCALGYAADPLPAPPPRKEGNVIRA
ncbi:MAG: nitroreductase [Thermoguttaceae bacterium]|jgi:nitroreductase|nr:nitroreductase [Thermoguttaceae bacterium]